MATPGEVDDTATSRIHKEIVRLKRELVRNDLHGHSCQTCQHIKLKSMPDFNAYHIGSLVPAFRCEATPEEIYDLAESDCIFWLMIRDWLAQVVENVASLGADSPTRFAMRWKEESCKKLADSLDRDETTEHHSYTPEDYTFLLHGYRPSYDQATDRGSVLIILEYCFDASEVSLYVTLVVPPIYINERPDVYWTELHILSLPESWRFELATPTNLNPASSGSMRLYQHWLKQCDVVHECGIYNLPSSMPSFVLDVTDSNTVKLLQVPIARKERYVALSYCWGVDKQAIMLQRSNKLDLLAGIALDRLDPTIRDSVQVARELGFGFLWVDALCIFQDDMEWKARELEKMGTIYRNATLTIVVSGEKDVTRGFLQRRTPTVDRGLPAFKFHVEETFEEGVDSSILLVPAKQKIFINEPWYQTEPWYQRAWTMQEMLFSKRRLQFRFHQTTWTCHCAENIVREYDGWMNELARPYFNLDFDPAGRLMRNGNVSTGTDDVLWDWLILVQTYSARQIRYHNDRLPAISAIARGIASSLGSDYVCGLWASYLPLCLSWCRHSKAEFSDRKSGPSWSWVSHDFEVQWENSERRDDFRWNQDFVLLGSTIDLKSPGDPFGAVREAELHVRGLLLPVSVTEKEGDDLVNLPKHDARVRAEFDYVDVLGDQRDPGRQPSLLVLVHRFAHTAKGIIVLEMEDNRYSRVGVFEMHDIGPDPWNKYTEEGLTKDEVLKSQETFRDRLRFLAGGEQAIREFVLI